MTESMRDRENEASQVLGDFLWKGRVGENNVPTPTPNDDPDAVDSFETTRFERLDASPMSFGEFLEEKHRGDIANFHHLQVDIDASLTALFYIAREPASVHEKFFKAHSIEDPAEHSLLAAWYDRAATGEKIRSLSDYREFGVSDERVEVLLTQFMARYGVRIGKLQSLRSSIRAYSQDAELKDFYAF